MRISYAPSIAPKDDAETSAVYERITERRAPKPLIPLDLAFLHSPPVADGYNSFLGALREKTILPKSLLELAICRVAILNSAVFEWNSHAPLALQSGLSRMVLQKAHDATPAEIQGRCPGLSSKEITILRYTDEMTRDIKVSDATFTSLKKAMSEREIVELTATISGYNCVSRFLVALDVGENNEKKMMAVSEVEAEVKKERERKKLPPHLQRLQEKKRDGLK